jgi:hypothetical protein
LSNSVNASIVGTKKKNCNKQDKSDLRWKKVRRGDMEEWVANPVLFFGWVDGSDNGWKFNDGWQIDGRQTVDGGQHYS